MVRSPAAGTGCLWSTWRVHFSTHCPLVPSTLPVNRGDRSPCRRRTGGSMTPARQPTAPLPEAPAPDPLASTPYRSIRPIGAGMMGDVFEAEHRDLRKRVVVKLFSLKAFEPGSVAAMEDRFRLEAQALASLDGHPNIVQVFDCGRTPEGQLYLV